MSYNEKFKVLWGVLLFLPTNRAWRSTGNSIPSAWQPLPNFILMMKLRTKAQQSLSSPDKSPAAKQKLKHGFLPPVLRQTPCWWSGQRWTFIKNRKANRTKVARCKTDIFETRTLRKVIFTNPKSYLKTANRSAVRARQLTNAKSTCKAVRI